MPARAAGEEHHAARLAQGVRRLSELLEVDLAFLEADPAEERVAHRAGLLVDLLQHEVAEAALLGLHRVPRDPLRGPRDGVAGEVRELHVVRRHRRDVAVLEEEEVAGVGEEGRDVRRHEALALAEADDERRPHARGHEPVWLVAVHEHEGVDPLDLAQRRARGLLERAAVERLDEVGHDLGVRLGHEAVALRGEPGLELEVVLDDAVVDDDDPARAVLVRVGVLLGRATVGRPARVAEAPLPGERVGGEARREVLELPRGASAHDGAVLHDRDPRRVVPAVLEPPQALEDHRDGVLPTDVAHDAAHVRLPPPLNQARRRQPKKLAWRRRPFEARRGNGPSRTSAARGAAVSSPACGWRGGASASPPPSPPSPPGARGRARGRPWGRPR